LLPSFPYFEALKEQKQNLRKCEFSVQIARVWLKITSGSWVSRVFKAFFP
jgi:hypothetical protein